MQVKVKVNDDLIDIEEDSLRIESVITSRIDTCSFSIRDASGSISIDEKDEVIISNVAETARYFGGYIASVERLVDGITRIFECDCQDYSVLLSSIIVNEVYENKTDKEIIQDLFTKYLNEISTVDYVEDGLLNNRIVFNRITLEDVINQLVEKSSYDWYVDYYKKLHYFTPYSNIASFELSDEPDFANSFPYSELRYTRDATKIVNKVTVVGGTYKSDDADFEGEANGVATEFLLPYKLHAPVGQSSILVYKNTGSDESPTWTQQTVGIDYVDTLGDGIDVLYNYNEKLLKFETAPPNLKRAVKVTGRYDVPVLVRARSQSSYEAYGRWFEDKVVDKDIDDKEWAKMTGKGYLAENAFVKERGSLECTQDGLVAGQRVKIKNSLRSIDGYYLINKVTLKILGGTLCNYKVEFGEYSADLIDYLIAIKAQAQPYQERREDEVLLELLSQEEVLALTELTDLHSDAFPPDWSRWIALPPAQGVGYHIRHEGVALAEDTDIDSHEKNNYLWDSCYWDFFSWA